MATSAYTANVSEFPPDRGRYLQRFRRDNVGYVALEEPGAVSPILLSTRKNDTSPDIALLLRLIQELYRSVGIVFGQEMRVGRRMRIAIVGGIDGRTLSVRQPVVAHVVPAVLLRV